MTTIERVTARERELIDSQLIAAKHAESAGRRTLSVARVGERPAERRYAYVIARRLVAA
jgi:hypothetical protein